MREIKFRGKTNSGNWVYGSLVRTENIQSAIYWEVGKGAIKELEWAYAKRETVGQFTGEVIGKQEIYEDDIIRITDNDDDEFNAVGVVKYIQSYYPAFDIYLKSDHAKTGWENYSDEFNAFSMVNTTLEKIGNIHDNPELLK